MAEWHGPARGKSGAGSRLQGLLTVVFASALILISLTAAEGEPSRRPAVPVHSDSTAGRPTPVATKKPPIRTASGAPGRVELKFTGSDAAGQPAHFQLPPGIELAAGGVTGASPQDWETGFTEDFEGDFPGSVWQLLDGSDDGFERTWGLDDFRTNSGNESVWVAAGGADGLDPEVSFYPDNLDAWMIVGPMDLRTAQAADVEFQMWRDTEPEYDFIFVGASSDGTNFDGEYWTGNSGGWQNHDVDLGPYLGLDQVWLAWYFHSDESNPEQDYEGVWVDDITLWHYTESAPPATTNLIENSDFETGDLTAWSSAGSTVVSSDNAHSGSYSAWLGGVDDASDGLHQVFDVPATDVNEARVNFWFELAGEETDFDADFFCAGIYRDSDDELLIDLGCLDGTDISNGWSEVNYALSGSELLAVAGETVYIDFYLETNGDLPTSVWVDDVAFVLQSGGTAGDNYEDNDAPSTATPLSFSTPISGLTIDPAGDVDYFAFNGSNGQAIAINIDAATNGSSLDSYVWLVDTDGQTVLAENDDDGNSFDSYLTYTLPADGTYYVIVSSYSGDGDRSFFYSISLTTDSGPPPTPPPTPTPPTSGKKAWTAILYLAGDTNLWADYPPYMEGLEAMIGDKASFLNVAVLLDLSQEAPNPRTTRYVIQPNGNYTDGVNRWDMGELNMGDPQNLVNFAKWAMQNYPADHYYLAIDDHGNSIAGISWDDTNNGDNLTPPELYAALKEITGNGAQKIDVLDWEACLMQTLEDAYDVRNFANYLFTFESTSTGGNTYPKYFQNLTAGTTPAQLAQSAFNAYFTARSAPVVGSVLDLSQVDAVRAAVDGLANALIPQLGTQKAAVTAARSASQKFEVDGNYRITDEDYYLDLWHVADRIAAQVPAVTDEANAVKSAIANAVLDYTAQSDPDEDHSHAHGLGIYWPQSVSGAYGDYANHRIFTVTRDGKWDDFLVSYLGRRVMGRRGMPVNPDPVPRQSTHTVRLPLVLRGK